MPFSTKFQLFRNDPETKHIFPLPPLISFKRDKNISNFLFRSAFKSDNQSVTFKCSRIYCITCTLCKKTYIGETSRRLADRFCEHVRDVEKNDTDTSKPVARHFNLPNQSEHNMTICGLSFHCGTTESRKNLEQKFIFQLGTLYPHGISECLSFH